MTQELFKPITVEEFLQWVSKKSGKRYELHNGAIVEMPQPLGEHEEVTGFLNTQLILEFTRLKLPYFISKTALIKSANSYSVYSPDIIVINKPALNSEENWAHYSIVDYGSSVPLVVEVVGNNWRDDYYKKQGEYEEIKIPEYWIVDYLGLGGTKHKGNPKKPTLSIYQLVNDEYEVKMFRGDESIISRIFPELNLTAQQIFNAAL